MDDIEHFWGRRDTGALCVDPPESFELHHVVEGLTRDDFIEIVRVYFGSQALGDMTKHHDGTIRYLTPPFEISIAPVACNWSEQEYASALILRIRLPTTLEMTEALAINRQLIGTKIINCKPIELQSDLMMGDGVLVGSIVGAIERLLLTAVNLLRPNHGARPN